MKMDFFFWIIVLSVISMIGGVLWWVFFFVAVTTSVRNVQQNLNQLLPSLEQQLRQANAAPGQINASQQANILQMLMQAQNQMHQLDGIHRMRYENRVGDLMGMAANAGIDWRPGDY
jgi:TolA-binding protein